MAIRPIGVREQSAIRGSNDLPRQGGAPAEGRGVGEQGSPIQAAKSGAQIQPPPNPAAPNGLAQRVPQILQPSLQQNNRALLANPNTLPVLSQQAAMANFLTPNVSLPIPPVVGSPGQAPQQPSGPVPQGANTGPNANANAGILSRLIRGV